jgi:NhaP-type Na+/H+ or K+/H+ antiporter
LNRILLSLLLFVMGFVLMIVVEGLLGNVMLPEIIIAVLVGLIAAIAVPLVAIRVMARKAQAEEA